MPSKLSFLLKYPLSAVFVRMALWSALRFPAQFMSPGPHGAPAQFHVGMARGRGHASARKWRAALPVLTQLRQRAVNWHHVQVRDARLNLFIT